MAARESGRVADRAGGVGQPPHPASGRDDPDALRRWQRGLTGYPLVDAGMRELWTTGWMHNRVRMVTASFLTRHLLLDWRLGENWCWDTLVDADWANNSVGWQWVAGCGADAAPYFRVFNPGCPVAPVRSGRALSAEVAARAGTPAEHSAARTLGSVAGVTGGGRRAPSAPTTRIPWSTMPPRAGAPWMRIAATSTRGPGPDGLEVRIRGGP